jgi:predicted DNA-binding antitoxin AbrB/MazE fold protein
MSQTTRCEAIFENGVFKPLSPVRLPEHARVLLEVTVVGSPSHAIGDVVSIAEQQRVLSELQAELSEVRDQLPTDGLTGRDHDRILYGALP